MALKMVIFGRLKLQKRKKLKFFAQKWLFYAFFQFFLLTKY